MSAEKQQDTGGNEPAVTGGADPSALAALAGALRTRLSFQQRLGLRAYPASPGLRRFLAGPQRPRQEPARGVVRPPVRAAAQPPALPADSGGLDSLRRDLEACTLCALAATRWFVGAADVRR